MSQPYPPLEEGCYYHIYNRANGSDNLFRQEQDYRHFLQLYQKYILPIADTFAWVLMPNHFHLLVRIKVGRVYKYSKDDFKFPDATSGLTFENVKWETIANPLNPSASERPDGVKGINKKPATPTHHFGHLCNAYAKYVNEKYQRHGSLFQKPFRRKPVDNERYLRQLILYIHSNAVHHGFVSHIEDYPWSSYHSCLSSENTELCRNEVLSWLGGLQNFRTAHQNYTGHQDVDKWLAEE